MRSVIRSIAKHHRDQTTMNARAILTNIVSFVTPKMHVARRKAVIDCVQSLANGSAATVISIGRGIQSNAFDNITSSVLTGCRLIRIYCVNIR